MGKVRELVQKEVNSKNVPVLRDYARAGRRPTVTPDLVDGVVDEANRREFDFEIVSVENWPQKIDSDQPSESELGSLQTVELNDSETGVHPLRTVRLLLSLIQGPVDQLSEPHISKATEVAEAYLESGTETESAYYFPYSYEFQLHGSEGILSPPWYSGMTQGVALSAFTRLALATGQNRWRNVAEKVFNSFLGTGVKQDKLWVSALDDEGYYRILEYPQESPCFVLNGHNYGIWGLYEYWCAFDEPAVEMALSAAVTTIRETVDRFRVPKEVSRYCLSHGVQCRKYHGVHCDQMSKLYEMTGDEYFKQFGTKLQKDSKFRLLQYP